MTVNCHGNDVCLHMTVVWFLIRCAPVEGRLNLETFCLFPTCSLLIVRNTNEIWLTLIYVNHLSVFFQICLTFNEELWDIKELCKHGLNEGSKTSCGVLNYKMSEGGMMDRR